MDKDPPVRRATAADETTTDSLQDLLSDPHVRYLIEHLADADEPVNLETLATHVVAGVTDGRPAAVADEDRARVKTFLHHGHLPELARHGIVEFDRESDTVVLTD
jgi:hypothetical protein